MVDTLKSLTNVLSPYTNNTNGEITFQHHRDGFYSTIGVVPFAAKTSGFTFSEDDEFVAIDAAGGNVTGTLPAVATTRVGKRYVVKLVEATGDGIIDGASTEEIDGAETFTLDTLNQCVVIVNSGTAWYIESLYTPA